MSDHRLMPVEPDVGMVGAGARVLRRLPGAGKLATQVYRSMCAAAPAVQGEPVAVMYEDGSLLSKADCGDNFEICCKVQTPLYAAPQPAEREILGSYPVSGQIFFRGPSNEWVLELTGSVNGTTFTARHTQPADTRPEDVAGLPALYESTPDITQLVEAASAALDEIKAIMREAYNSAEPVCCGRGGAGGCCGSPEPEWSEIDQNTIGRLWPHQRALTSALAAYRKGGEV